MTVQIQTLDLQPRRKTFAHIARRFGEDRLATRYEEATFDLQATRNFHYRPLWDAEHEIFDPSRTAIAMEDWYVFKDPRQFYYATYNINRAGMQAVVDKNFQTVEKHGLLASVGAEWLDTIKAYLLPLRHFEWGANMNNTLICDFGYGTQLTSAAAFCAADRLGMAQIIGHVGLLLDDNTGDSLDAAKTAWLEAPEWQELRRMLEDSFVEKDWFQVFVAQNLAMDGMIYPLFYTDFGNAGIAHGATGLSLLTEFMVDWHADNNRWVDMVIKTAAAESPANAEKLSAWFGHWAGRAEAAMRPLAARVLGDKGDAAVDAVRAALDERAGKLGLSL